MKWQKEKLRQLIEDEKLSYEEIGRRYECSGTWIKKVALRFGVKIEPRRKINENETFNRTKSKKACVCQNCGQTFYPHYASSGKYCSNKCQQEYRSNKKYQEYLNDPSEYYGQESMKWVKKHILKEQDGKCIICGQSNIWNGKPLTFILDHIDGHANNNERSNLRLVCPNCDSQLDTYKSKNKKSDRIYYHFHYRR